MNKLRDICDSRGVYNEDQYCAVLPVPNSTRFLVMSWYKRRGRTEGAWIVDSTAVIPLTIEEAEAIIEGHDTGHQQART